MRDAGPTDEEIAARLAAQPEERWQELFARAGALTAADLEVGWGVGQEISPGVTQMPYPVYSEAVTRITGLLGELGVVVAFAWPGWHRAAAISPDGRELRDLPVADAARLATTIIRGERFSEGTIGAALRGGALQAILDRLRRWHDHERP
ncbi:DUF6508 domain-containing protein [Nonomuraea sp. NPDC048916]|uniref:DUF6508 domain-containing protein n=1 Tax=Nonomuraea sp. NPDC048916 TaxID=3154232 RepID=UPI0033C05537